MQGAWDKQLAQYRQEFDDQQRLMVNPRCCCGLCCCRRGEGIGGACRRSGRCCLGAVGCCWRTYWRCATLIGACILFGFCMLFFAILFASSIKVGAGGDGSSGEREFNANTVKPQLLVDFWTLGLPPWTSMEDVRRHYREMAKTKCVFSGVKR